MPAWTSENGKNYADEIDYRWWNDKMQVWVFLSLDEAVGKVVSSTEVSPYDGSVTVYVKDK